jgi:hypothetical protein
MKKPDVGWLYVYRKSAVWWQNRPWATYELHECIQKIRFFLATFRSIFEFGIKKSSDREPLPTHIIFLLVLVVVVHLH